MPRTSMPQRSSGCPILAALLFLRLGWDASNLHAATLKRVPHPRRAFVLAARVGCLEPPCCNAHASNAETFGIHSEIGICCGHASSQIPHATHDVDRCI